ncbi:MAG: DNA polymerase III subunit gamma/tau [Balneolaceae bacterium]
MKQNYRALTRTYRPQTFDDIVSQEHVSNTLKNAIRQNRLSHAYMFSGPRGVGKTTMARVLARAVNEIDEAVDGESLNQTLNIVEMDAASNRKIDDVRSLKEVIRVPPQNGKYKIFIIDEVHMLTPEAFNALLKTLEEPPAHAIFIFATTEPHKVLPTILSRVQRFDFKRISVGEIVKRLSEIAVKENITIDVESLHVIAKRADGALRDALGLMDQAIAFCGDVIEYQELLRALNVVDKNHLFSFIRAAEERDAHAGLSLIHELLQAGTDIQEFLVSLTEHLRNLYVARNTTRDLLLEVTQDTKQQFIDQANKFTDEDLMRMLHLVSEAQFKLKEAQQPRVHFEILMLKLIHMHRSVELNSLLEKLEEVKKNFGEGGSTAGVTTGADIPALDQGSGKGKVDTPDPSTPEEKTRSSGKIDTSGTGRKSAPESSNRRLDAQSESPKAPAPDPDIYGEPSLGKSESMQIPENGKQLPKREDPSNKEKERELKGVQDVHDHWEEFLEAVESLTPKMLYYQVQRIQVQSLKGREIYVTVDNEFAHKMVIENRQVLSDLLKKVIGVKLQFQCKVIRDTGKESETMSTFEQFKQLQQKDPHLRTLVELFGAELEY